MIDYSYLNDGSLTAAFGNYQRQKQSNNDFRESLKAEIMAEVRQMIREEIKI